MNQIKKLAGQTAYYGISSILGRVLNFLLLPIWTARLDPSQYGAVSETYSYVALFLIVYTFGMETAYFRFARKTDGESAYHSAGTAVLLISIVLSSLLAFFAEPISSFIDEDVRPQYIQFLAAILFIDAIVAIPFARLRIEEKALRFAVIKLIVISLTIILNLLLIVVFPDIINGQYLQSLKPTIESFYNIEMGIGYIFVANLLANSLYIPLLLPELRKFRLRIEWQTFKPMLKYAAPLFVMGLAGMFNENGYALVFEWAFPKNLEVSASDALGKYASAVKLSVIMMLGIQAFRYAAEPFFFNHADNREAPELFAKIMHYFVVFNVVVMVAISLNIDLISDIFLRNPAYKDALYVLPILLLAKLLYGVYVNLSVWFKIKDKTIFGSYFAGIGAAITLAGNLLLIPIIGYFGSALASLICYGVMSCLCYYYGKKYFPVPYKIAPLVIHAALGLIIIYGVNEIRFENELISYTLSFFIALTYTVVIFWYEWRNLDYKTLKQ